jgi:anti-sigma B factor antagonist
VPVPVTVAVSDLVEVAGLNIQPAGRRVRGIRRTAVTTPMLDITPHVRGPITVLRVRGEIDLATSAYFGATLIAAVASQAAVVADMSEVVFLGSHGLRELEVARLTAHQADKRFVLADLARPVSRVLALTGLTPHFTIYPSVDDALAAVASAA